MLVGFDGATVLSLSVLTLGESVGDGRVVPVGDLVVSTSDGTAEVVHLRWQ